MNVASASSRLFVALWPDDAVRTALAFARDRCDWSASARPTPTSNLHVTLVFLGAVDAARVPDVVAALPVFFEPFDLRLDRPAVWSNGIAALEPADPPAALGALQGAIAERTAALGIAAEARRYRPHVTLARDARGSTMPMPEAGVLWTVADYALIESRSGRYRVLAQWRR